MFWATLIHPGVGRLALPTFLSYYKPGYQARQAYDTEMIERWRRYVDDGPVGQPATP
jgi:hypothetical protein